MGGDDASGKPRMSIIGFNPRLRMGGDMASVDRWRLLHVSIHASAWEATTSCSAPPGGTACFNPRLRMGGDFRPRAYGSGRYRFNPRLRMGGDRRGAISANATLVSIHASAWEATRHRDQHGDEPAVSIHASAWEATRCSCQSPPTLEVSIHASAWEATQREKRLSPGDRVSIHASAWEATWYSHTYDAIVRFQSTPPTESTLCPMPAACRLPCGGVD